LRVIHFVLNLSSVKTEPKVSIGLPVYNGEKFLRRRIDSILSQTFKNFEFIISDNASSDLTQAICDEYAKKDSRIRYIRQEKNNGPNWNFNFVLREARSEYFAWAAADDVILPQFLEKNLKVLESNKDMVCSIGKVKLYDLPPDPNSSSIDIAFDNFRKKLLATFRPSAAHVITGSYEQKVRFLFKKSAYQVMYGLCRTDKLLKSIVDKSYVGPDIAIVLNLLKYGDIQMLDEILLHRFESGLSTKGIISIARQFNKGLIGILFPHLPITLWCAKHLGMKLFLKNIDHFLELNAGSELLLIIDLVRILVHKISRK